MGFFDLLKARKAAGQAPAVSSSGSQKPSAAPGSEPSVKSVPAPGGDSFAPVVARLAQARGLLEAKDLKGALGLYEHVLAEAGDRADVLVTISGDLGIHGHVQEIIEYIAPRYDAQRHGPATGLNVLQAYLVLKDPEAAQHVLDILFSLNRPELEERLYGFSNAIADMLAREEADASTPAQPGGPQAAKATVNLVTISKPIWFYGLEALASEILPAKGERLRRVAFGQLALPGHKPPAEAPADGAEDELVRLSRAIPLWLSETLYFSPVYTSVAALGLVDEKEKGSRYAVFGGEWSSENIQQLLRTSNEDFDYVFTGALRQQAGDYEMILRLWEVKKFRERKQLVVRWNPSTADAELGKLHSTLRLFMECASYPEGNGLRYAPPSSPTAWLNALGASVSLFLAGKKVLSPAAVCTPSEDLRKVAELAPGNALASLAFITMRKRAAELGLAVPEPVAPLADDPVVKKAESL